MNREEILAKLNTLTVGEKNAVVAKEIFGYNTALMKGFIEPDEGIFIPYEYGYKLRTDQRWCMFLPETDKSIEHWAEIPNYFGDISAAIQVLDKLKKGWDCITLLWDVGAWDIILENYDKEKTFYLGKESGLTYKELPEAICKVALITRLEEGKGNG